MRRSKITFILLQVFLCLPLVFSFNLYSIFDGNPVFLEPWVVKRVRTKIEHVTMEQRGIRVQS